MPEVGRGNTPDSLGSGGSRRVSSGFEAQPQPGYQPVPTSQPTQQQQVYQSAEQQPQPAGQPQQAYQPQGMFDNIWNLLSLFPGELKWKLNSFACVLYYEYDHQEIKKKAFCMMSSN